MIELLKDTNFDFIGKRWVGISTSMVIILIGVASLIFHKGPNYGIDFRGGVRIYAKFNRVVTEAELKSKLTQLGYEDVKIQVDSARQEASLDAAKMPADGGRIIADALLKGEGDWHAMPAGVNVSAVGPSVGKDLKWAAVWSIIWSLVLLLAYISYRFEFRFAIGAIIPLIHDVTVTLTFFSLLSKEVNMPTVAAFLTIVGYSLNDTIVVFDRIRENTKLLKGWDYGELLNKSINQTLSRTIITSLTVFMVVLALFFLTRSGEEINTFAFAMVIGTIAGSYSTIFIASPILYMWHLRDQKKAASPA
ncbi:protein translocase subunit SecF [Candidatus Poribacteria bacterium]|nr:protein translocase subunit SecF [Candidatus Poribacteria bacterium]